MVGDDAVDYLCRQWGRTRRKLLLEDPALAPEFIGEARLVDEAFHRLPEADQFLMSVHYASVAPVAAKIEGVGLARSAYFQRLRDIQCFVGGYTAALSESTRLAQDRK